MVDRTKASITNSACYYCWLIRHWRSYSQYKYVLHLVLGTDKKSLIVPHQVVLVLSSYTSTTPLQDHYRSIIWPLLYHLTSSLSPDFYSITWLKSHHLTTSHIHCCLNSIQSTSIGINNPSEDLFKATTTHQHPSPSLPTPNTYHSPTTHLTPYFYLSTWRLTHTPLNNRKEFWILELSLYLPGEFWVLNFS